jgi:TonB-dependent receptor-like protein/carboxypeptidase family protein
MLAVVRNMLSSGLAVLVLVLPLDAQEPGRGRIVGRVIDAASGDPIPGTQVTVEGTAIASIADWTGRFTLLDVPAGARVVTARMIGYQHKSVRDVFVQDRAAQELNITLAAAAVEVEAIEVTAEMESSSAARALDEQRTSNQIINAVSGEQIRKTPDSDAGQAVQRVSGVTVQDGRYVFVRGLGERYTQTALNGARIPSPEPERKVVPLDLFPSGLLDQIVTAKTFTPDQSGDFSGAQVDLRTRDFLVNRVINVTMSGGINDAVTGTILPFAPTEGSEWLGYAGTARELPAMLASDPELQSFDQAELNAAINSFRNVWSSRMTRGGGKGSFGVSIGGSDPVFGRLFDYVASLSYANETEARVDERHALANSTTPGDVINAYHGATGRRSVLWGGLLNVSTSLGSTGRLRLENTYTRGGDNEAIRMAGFNNEFDQNLDITRLAFTERTVRSHQLRGEHLIAGRNGFEWSASASSVRRYEPDRSDLVYQTTIDSVTGGSQPFAWYGSPRSANRTFNDLDEHGYEASMNYRRLFGGTGDGRSVKVGGLYRTAVRDAYTYAYDIVNIPGLNDTERRQTAEAIFQGTYADQGKFLLDPDVVLGSYTADDELVAGFVQLELSLSRRWRIIGGARVERDRLVVRSNTLNADTTSVLDNTDVLPALSVTYSATQRHNLRFSLSQTVTRPEYREISPVTSLEPLGGQSQSGNPTLRRGLIRNADVRWEWYPTPGQVLSAGVFAKRFIDPIERILISSAQSNAGIISWVNAERANNYGLELELRSNLGGLARPLQPFAVMLNTTLMRSEIVPGSDSLSSLTSAKRAMVGQANYVVNAGLTYSADHLTANVLYNVVGPRIREAAIAPLPDVIEHARHVIDISLQTPVGPRSTIKFDAKNLLDSPYKLTQGPNERHYFRTGRVYALGINWAP